MVEVFCFYQDIAMQKYVKLLRMMYYFIQQFNLFLKGIFKMKNLLLISKQIFLFLIAISYFISISMNIYSFPPVEINPGAYTYRDNTTFSIRDIDVPPTPCNCACSDMVLSTFERFDGQADSDIYLRGGLGYPGYNCQKLLITVSACNNSTISSIKLKFSNFTSNSQGCQNYPWTILDNNGYPIGSSFDPITQEITIPFDPVIQPCTKRDFVFYVCTDDSNPICDHLQVSAEISILNQTPPCTNTLYTMYFDFTTGINPNDPNDPNIPNIPNIKIDYQEKNENLNFYLEKNINENEVYSIVIYDINKTIINSFKLDNKSMNYDTSKLNTGIYWIEVKNQTGEIVQLSKFTLVK